MVNIGSNSSFSINDTKMIQSLTKTKNKIMKDVKE